MTLPMSAWTRSETHHHHHGTSMPTLVKVIFKSQGIASMNTSQWIWTTFPQDFPLLDLVMILQNLRCENTLDIQTASEMIVCSYQWLIPVDPFSQILDPGVVVGSSFSNERLPQIFPTHDSNTLTWPTNDFPTGPAGGMPDFSLGNVVSTEGTSQGSTLREESQGISYPILPAFSERGDVNVFDSFTSHPKC